jgi:hypothetical protein
MRFKITKLTTNKVRGKPTDILVLTCELVASQKDIKATYLISFLPT